MDHSYSSYLSHKVYNYVPYRDFNLQIDIQTKVQVWQLKNNGFKSNYWQNIDALRYEDVGPA